LIQNQKSLVKFNNAEQKYLNDLSKLYPSKLLTNNQILDIIAEYRDTKDNGLIFKIIRNFIKLLIKSVRRYNQFDINAGELVHAGVLGIIDAVESSFKLDSNTKFITYITLVIERRMKDALDINRNTIRLPRHRVISQRKAKFTNKDGDKTDIYTMYNVKDFKDFTTIISKAAPDTFEDAADKNLEKESLVFDLNRILNNILTKIEIEVVVRHFGLQDGFELPLKSINRNLELPANESELILEEALKKIRESEKGMNILYKYVT